MHCLCRLDHVRAGGKCEFLVGHHTLIRLNTNDLQLVIVLPRLAGSTPQRYVTHTTTQLLVKTELNMTLASDT
jgi:hypothetical protein